MKPLLLVGEALGSNEVKIGKSFVGPSGVELIRMLHESGCIDLTAIDRDYIDKFYRTGDPLLLDAVWNLHPEVHRTNVFNLHPPGNKLESFCGPKAGSIGGFPSLGKSQYVRAEFEPELLRLQDELISIDPNLIVCLGNTALWALAGRTGISKLRGTTLLSTHTVDGFKLLPTYHPAAVLRQWELRPTTIADLMKASRESAYPEIRRPHREIWIEPSIEDIQDFITNHIRGCSLLSTDIETSGTRITEIGFAPSHAIGIVIPFDDSRRVEGSYWPSGQVEKQAWTLIRGVLEDSSIPKLYQNAPYDVTFKLRAYGIRVRNVRHDTMLLHHALHPESLKALGFLGSIYSEEFAWKGMRKKTETIKADS